MKYNSAIQPVEIFVVLIMNCIFFLGAIYPQNKLLIDSFFSTLWLPLHIQASMVLTTKP